LNGEATPGAYNTKAPGLVMIFASPFHRYAPLAAVALALSAFGCAAGPPAASARNVVLVTIDTLRADHLSTYGYARATSPALDRLAARGTRFSHAFSAASCTAASHASILTGLLPSFHTIGAFNGIFPLDPGTDTLAEVLSARGWTTAAVVSNPVLARRIGLDQGFATYDDDIQGHELNRAAPEQRADVALGKARALLAGLHPPFFLWLHLQDPHGPYAPPPGRDRFDAAAGDGGGVLPVGEDQSGYGAIPPYQVFGDERRVDDYVARYDDEIAYTFDELGRWLDELAASGRLADTLVAVTADHGEALGEDGFYFGHGHSVGPDQVRVPLLLAGPGVPAGRVVVAPVSNAALFNTVLAAVGLRERPDPEVAGLAPLLAGAGAQEPPPVFVESLNQVGVAVGGVYYRRDRAEAADDSFWRSPNPTTGGFWKPLGAELSALDGPPPAGTPAPPAGTPPSRAALDRLLDGFERRARRAAPHLTAIRRHKPLTDEERANLRALGYAG
jgi:Sulfatase